MFGKNKASDVGSEVDIPILTIDHFPGREYEVIGTVWSEVELDLLKKAAATIAIQELNSRLCEEAISQEYDAILGFRTEAVRRHVGANNSGPQILIGYGTGIRFK